MAGGGSEQETGPVSVLVIDDDKATAAAIVAYLRNGGLSAHAENNGFAGVSAAKSLNPRLVLLDVQMPGLDGIETAALIRRALPQTRIILMSGHPASLVEANRNAKVAFAVLEKPLPLPAILDFVRRVLS
ncbi:MAG: response regulator [Minwuia sp.]|nr:response regulator [Minwuia sp.]